MFKEAAMQIVRHSSDHLGSFEWVLPKNLSEMMSALPIESQHAVRTLIESEVEAHLHLFLGATMMGPVAATAFEYIRECRKATATSLKEALVRPRRKWN